MDGIAPGVRVIDITHQSEPYNIAMGAELTIPRKGLKFIDGNRSGRIAYEHVQRPPGGGWQAGSQDL
jgi:hypothetical protein